MAKFPVLVSPDGRVHRVITSTEELEKYEARGYKRSVKQREPIDSGAEGNQRARESSTTEGSERNSGTTARRTRD